MSFVAPPLSIRKADYSPLCNHGGCFSFFSALQSQPRMRESLCLAGDERSIVLGVETSSRLFDEKLSSHLTRQLITASNSHNMWVLHCVQ